MKEIILKGIIDEEWNGIVYKIDLNQVENFEWWDIEENELYICIKKEEILDEKEKEYLRAVIRPFKERVMYIKKIICGNQEYIEICVFGEFVHFPFFEKGKMYKGMEEHKEYTLEELGL